MFFLQELIQAGCLALLCAATAYETVAVTALLWWRWRTPEDGPALTEAVSVLKPLCGSEPGLYDQLRSFCQQDYPQYEIVFGIRDAADPAGLVVDRLAAEFPHLPITLVCDPQQYGNNLKVGNLINMLRRARHGILLISDSDVQVGPDYLTRVTAPLRDPRIGLVTSLYRAVGTADIWSRLAAMYINEWYMPSVLLARMFGYRGYASGQTLCLRRKTLEDCGGLSSFTDHLAEDHQFGERVQQLGLQIVISPYPVVCTQHEPTLGSLCDHELRWLRTLRALAPLGFRGLFVTFSLPLGLAALLGVRLAATGPEATLATGLFAVIAAGRVAMHLLHRRESWRELLRDLWLVPIRDLLLVWEWAEAFVNGRVVWRGREFRVDRSGVLHCLTTNETPRQLSASRTEHLAN